jgi:hypothetical protein
MLLLCAGSLSAGTITITPEPLSGTEGFTLSGQIATFTDSALPSTADLTGSIDWGDGTSSAGGITGSAGSYDLTGSHIYTEQGAYTVSIGIDDTGDDTGGGSLTTASIADAPLSQGPTVNGSGIAGVAIDGLVGIFSDANPFAPTSDFTVTINWGDGAPATFGTISQPEGVGTLFDISGSHTYAVAGLYDTTVLVDDKGGSTTSEFGSENITSAPEPGTFLFCGAGVLFGFAGLRFRHPGECSARKTQSR